jgi:hypothetical protein
LDWLEDGRPLTKLELFFREMVKQKIERLIHSIAVAARQRWKVNWCFLGDEDTKFYHARASARLRSNQIKVIQQDGVPYYT